ncbi:MAG: hypothetical protein R2568_10595 [Candidatus Scalindua sp.]|nr:hypothetical protein [Candidatus Scalindua sp.]
MMITLSIGVEHISPRLCLFWLYQHTGLNTCGCQFYKLRFEVVKAFADDIVQTGAE